MTTFELLVSRGIGAKGYLIFSTEENALLLRLSKSKPAKDELEGKVAPKASGSGVKTGLKDTKVASSVVAPGKVSSQKSKGKEGFKTITLTERFHCRPHDIYSTLLDENRWKGFTQSKANVSKEVGGHFSIFDGSVVGINMKLEEDKLIMQKWRFQNWHDGQYSTVCLTFEEPEIGVTIVKLTQTDVPEEDRFGNATVVENTQRGWKEHIFHRIRAVFGFGI
ncbi:hypothetical protein KP509_30G009200 [Ceratopteris richardii]|uniref:Activator of Hsp90 ATPase homologue 1/2-like C-terminal domain-containing protein n=1 Tax=Ceratopteris richardii TaxID=49495 RepID=A0A8T2R1G0_CERRI|nr:hypothetical protein KP509_30G009200 [Ceratopteris richardii]